MVLCLDGKKDPAQPEDKRGNKFMYVYADNAATTAVSPAAVTAMTPCFSEIYGNASSLHSPGQRAAEVLTAAREKVAALLNAREEAPHLHRF